MNNFYFSQQYMMQFVKNVPPLNRQILTTTDNQRIAFAEFGNPKGEIILFLHGGPGGLCQPIDLAFFDLTKQRVILFDQRHCGNSRTATNWGNQNTTDLIISDIEQLRNHLNINQWNIFGGSWGTCLGLCYAIKQPTRVKKQVYWGILLGRQSCIDFVPASSLSPMEKFYCDNHFFLEENFIINNIDKIKDIPTFIAHGENDSVCSVENAKELANHLNNTTLFIATGEEHHPYMPQMFQALRQFTKNI
jgi:pimeloyl-ACP methyl ester carboxylesterase